MAQLWNPLRMILLIAAGLAAFLAFLFLAGFAAYPFGVYGTIALVFVLLGAYFLIGRWVLRRL